VAYSHLEAGGEGLLYQEIFFELRARALTVDQRRPARTGGVVRREEALESRLLRGHVDRGADGGDDREERELGAVGVESDTSLRPGRARPRPDFDFDQSLPDDLDP
jgi:hypothetical protein